jgi:hypothetical protein
MILKRCPRGGGPDRVAGRRIALGEAVMTAAGREVLHARVWFASQSSADARTPDVVHGTVRTEASTQPVGPTAPEHRRAGPEDYPESLREWRFPYAEAMQWRSVSGDALGPGDAAVWSTPRIPLVPGRRPSGLQRAVLVADSANGVSAALDWERWSFVNVDLDVHLSRPLRGEWVLLDASTRYQPTGTGLATSVLSDIHGVVGAGAQTLVVSAR